VAPWITVLSRHTVFTKGVIYYKIYFCVIFRKTSHHAQAHVTSGTLCPFFGHENTDGTAVGWFCWPLSVMVTSAEAGCCHCSSSSSKLSSNIASFCTWFQGCVSKQNFTDEFLLKFYLYFFLPLLETRNRLPRLDYYVWMGTVSET